MLTSLSKKIELIANVAIIVVACLLATVLVKNYFFTKASQQANQSESQLVQSQRQSVDSLTVSSLDIDWKQNRQTLVLAISRIKAMENQVNVKKVIDSRPVVDTRRFVSRPART